MTRTLIVARDRRLGQLLRQGLRAEGHEARLVAHPRTASALVDYDDFDLVVLDEALRDLEGFEMLRESCAGPGAPALLGVENERGPDAVPEVVARARAAAEQGPVDDRTRLSAGGVELDPWKRRARAAETDVSLTDREFSLLWVFLRHPGRVLSREELHLHAWGHESSLGSNAVEVYVAYLRRKLGAEVIETVRGRGYRLDHEARFGAEES